MQKVMQKATHHYPTPTPRANPARGRLFVVSAPSGAGKTSITSRLRQMSLVDVSISHTTRQPREGERDGEHYFFVSRNDFIAMRDDDHFLESAEVYGNFYGTSHQWVSRQLAEGRNVLLEIDCQGAMQIREKFPDVVMIFIAPPDMTTLRARLEARRQDDTQTLERRLAAAESEMAKRGRFDHVITNNRLEDAVREVAAVIKNALHRDTE